MLEGDREGGGWMGQGEGDTVTKRAYGGSSPLDLRAAQMQTRNQGEIQC